MLSLCLYHINGNISSCLTAAIKNRCYFVDKIFRFLFHEDKARKFWYEYMIIKPITLLNKIYEVLPNFKF